MLAPATGPVASVALQPTFQPQAVVVSSGLTPQQIRTAYGVDQAAFGAIKGDGTGQTIAIVDAYDDPGLVNSSSPSFQSSDLALFDKRFGLPDPPSFEKLGQGGTSALPAPDPTGEWEVEEALDVEWAHAMAPGASIILIECNSPGYESLLNGGVKTAARIPGVSVVSLSFGTYEFSSEQLFDGDFTTPSGHQGVTFVASTGDYTSSVEYPASSPNVVAVGGTSLALNANNTYNYELNWPGSGAGTSAYEAEPGYQQNAQRTGARTIPDVVFDADGASGVQIYDSYHQTNPWFATAGTSFAAACWAGLIAIADQGRVAAGGTTLDGRSQTLPELYSLPAADFHEISGAPNGNTAILAYNSISGLGSPEANLLLGDLAAYGTLHQVSGNPVQTPSQPGENPVQTASQLVITNQVSSTVSAGAPFGLAVAVEDTSGNVVTSFSGAMTVTLESNVGGSTLAGQVTVMVSLGEAQFSGLAIDKAGANYVLEVNCQGLATTSNSFNVVAGSATHLVVVSEPPPILLSGSHFAITVYAEDAFGNLATSYNGNAVVALTGPHGKTRPGGTLSELAINGHVTFSNLNVKRVGAGYKLTVIGHGLPAVTTSLFSVVLPSKKAVASSRARQSVVNPQSRPQSLAAHRVLKPSSTHRLIKR